MVRHIPRRNLTLADMLKKGNDAIWSDKKLGYNHYYWPGDTAETSSRHPFYFIHLKEVADTLKANLEKDDAKIPGWADQEDFFDYWKPIPHWMPNTNTNPDGDMDMYAINWKMPFYANGVGAPHENVWLQEIIRTWTLSQQDLDQYQDRGSQGHQGWGHNRGGEPGWQDPG